MLSVQCTSCLAPRETVSVNNAEGNILRVKEKQPLALIPMGSVIKVLLYLPT